VDKNRKFRNYYKDECLVKAGGQANGTLDFYQVHSYSTRPSNSWSQSFSAYKLDKPLVIGEFSSKSSKTDVGAMYRHAADTGYSGAWDWALVGGDSDGNDSKATCIDGVHSL